MTETVRLDSFSFRRPVSTASVIVRIKNYSSRSDAATLSACPPFRRLVELVMYFN